MMPTINAGSPLLATVAITGDYSDLSGTPALSTVATTGAYADLSGTPSLGTAAAHDVGIADGDVVQVQTGGKLPALDGSNLTNLPTPPGLATVATTGAYSDLTGTPSLASVAITGAYNDLTGKPTLATVATSGAYSDLSGKPTGALTNILQATANLTFDLILMNDILDRTVTITGAAVGDPVVLGPPPAFIGGSGGIPLFFAWVSATDTVTVRCYNGSAAAVSGIVGGYTFNIAVLKF
jgi:hypothetical protein